VGFSSCLFRGDFGPKIDKKTHLKNQSSVDGMLLGFLARRNRLMLHKCARGSKVADDVIEAEFSKLLCV
jgi:hypothetical protein